ncbi:ABC-2 type transport system permease protein [Pelagirhabdus alkalitolerans]|uniref:ABC-2 type transport system permease protein n=1 Tax=Pelagirhabdus alkalitolerans TaxID=1612202 RepID=A0A1G6NCW7_9BACI|nr:ABC transporter permease [Pelagirhabdus alkalitolerans]SDC65673.1 ABC-2 type transport system permease protein [Pelagirhabdus alkalitolerans]
MRKFWVVLSQSYMTRLKSKSFLITTALFMGFILLAGQLDVIFSWFEGDDETQVVAVQDETDQTFDELELFIEESGAPFELEAFDEGLEEGQSAVLDEEYEGFLMIRPDDESYFVANYYTDQLINQSVQDQLMNALQQVRTLWATEAAGIDQEILEEIYEPVMFETVPIESDDGTTARSQEELSVARGLVYVMLFVLYFAVITYGNMIAMDIANEKSSRVMEILISSSSPVGQMFAKIIGIGLLGLTQIGLFILVGFYTIESQQDELVGGFFEVFGFQDVPVSTYVYAVVFFLLGYFLYATLSAMLGSLVSRMEEVNQLMMPVILLIVAAFMLSMFGINLPESSVITITSFIPFFSPLVMFLRVGLLEVPIWEIGLSIGILILSIGILAVIGARVYRGGVLMYGKGTSLKDFKRALTMSKKD